MKKNTFKKVAAIAMATTLLFSMTACGKKEEEQSQEKADTKEMVYEGTAFNLEGVEGDISNFHIENGKIYFLTYEWIEGDKEKKDGAESDKAVEPNEETSEEDSNKEQNEETSEENSDKEVGKETSGETSDKETSEGISEENTDKETSEETTEDSSGEGAADEEEIPEGTSVTRMYVANIDGSGVKEVPLPEIKDNEYINYLITCSDDNIMYMSSSYDEKSEKSTYYVVKIDKQGKEVAREDVTGSLKLSEENYISKVTADDKGRIVVVTDKSVYVLDENFKLYCEVKSDNYLEGAARTKEGKIVCGSSGEKGAQVQILDIDQKKWGESYPLNLQYFSSSDSLTDGIEYDFYYKDDSGIYGYDIKTKKSTKLMDYLASDLDSDSTYSIVPLEKDKFIGNTYENEKTQVVIYSKVDSSAVADKQIITVGAMYVDDSVKKAAVAFNKENKEYRIEIKDYSNEEDPQTKMNADILAGNVPDIICLGSLPAGQYIAKGMLEDLTPYFEKDSEINTSDILDSVLEAMEVDGKLYYVCPNFTLSTLVGNAKDVGTEPGWTFEDMMALLDKKGENVRPFYSENKSEMLYSFLGYGVSDFIDWQTGECSFDSQEFKDILEICNRGKNEETEYNEDSPSIPSLIKDGKVLFMDGSVSLEEIQLYKKMFDGDITFIGYPNSNKEGSYFSFYNSLGIYSKSKMKDGAWDFIRTFMTKDYQGSNENGGYMYNTPTRKDCFDMMIKARMATESYTDEFGNEISPVESSYGWDDLEVKIKPSSQEEVDMYKELVNNTKKSGEYNEFIMEIIQEETKAYFSGDKSLDEVASVIQNRVKTYVNENR